METCGRAGGTVGRPYHNTPAYCTIFVAGYSAAQANHFTCTESSGSSVQPLSWPSTQRPAASQREPVSSSLNGAGGASPRGFQVSLRIVTAFAAPPPGGVACGRYAAAVTVGPFQSSSLPSIVSASAPSFDLVPSCQARAAPPSLTPRTNASAGSRGSAGPRLLTDSGFGRYGRSVGLYFGSNWYVT